MPSASENTENNSVVLPSNNTTLQSLIVNTTVPTLNNNTETTDVKNKICEYCFIFYGVIFVMALVGAVLAYIILAIMYLVQDYDIANECKGSSLWAYVLTAIILAFFRSNAKSDDKNGPNIGVFILLGFIECGLAIWGGIELWEKSCSDLSDTNLWQIGLITFILQVMCATIFLIIVPLAMCCIVYKDSNEMHRSSTSFNIV